MKLGIFDSGLGGLVIAKAIRRHIPDIDMVYLGDTMRLPYGNRSTEAIYNFTRRGVEFLFEKQDCALIVIACNTASAAALRTLQQTWLPGRYPGRNILGVVVPTLEAVVERGYKKPGLIATNYTIHSNAYGDELEKLSPGIELIQKATPLLVPLIENDGQNWAQSVLEHYLAPMSAQGMECLVLGCTHYPFLKTQIGQVLGTDFPLVSQDEIVPGKLAEYLERHPEYADSITRTGASDFYVTDLTESYRNAAHKIYGQEIAIEKAEI